MVRMSVSFCSTRERNDCGGGGSAVEGDYHEARVDAMVRWSRSKSSGIEEGHSGEGLARTCGRANTTRMAKPRSRS